LAIVLVSRTIGNLSYCQPARHGWGVAPSARLSLACGLGWHT
jgi:hypothetical protein